MSMKVEQKVSKLNSLMGENNKFDNIESLVELRGAMILDLEMCESEISELAERFAMTMMAIEAGEKVTDDIRNSLIARCVRGSYLHAKARAMKEEIEVVGAMIIEQGGELPSEEADGEFNVEKLMEVIKALVKGTEEEEA